MHLSTRVAAWSSCALVLAALLSASPRRLSGDPPPTRATARDELVCGALVLPDRRYSVTRGSGRKLEYPQHDGRVAKLEFPNAAIPEGGLTVDVRAPAPDRARVDIIVRRTADGVEIHDFSDPLTLTLFVRDGCAPSSPSSGNSFYIYVVEEPAGEGYGDHDGPLWPVRLTGNVKARLCHLSGFILAQGNKPTGLATGGRGNGGDRCP